MNSAPLSPVVRDLVLAGGGHSHVAVIKSLRMRPLAGLRVTLVSRGFDTPYSGMLPGVVAGLYSRDEAYIDLERLCRHCGVRLIRAEIEGLDPDSRQLRLAGRPAVSYDVLSVNTGSTPLPTQIDAAAAHAVVFAKPIDRFLEQWERLRMLACNGDDAMRIAIVGAGAAGVELALSIERRLRESGAAAGRCAVELVSSGEEILETHSPRVRACLMRSLHDRGIAVRTQARVEAVVADERNSKGVRVRLADGRLVAADAVVFATQASPAPWLADSALATDARGFVVVNEFLQSVSHADVFAAGDVASSASQPRPKAGVFAVRQGMPLARNLRRYLTRQPLRRFVPQRHFLSLIGTADGRAVASRGRWCAHGRWVWRWKDRIDRKFMERFSVEDRHSDSAAAAVRMPAPDPAMLAVDDARELADPHGDGMRCAGCGSKVSADVLSRALARLRISEHGDVLCGVASRDDAAVLRPPAGRCLALSVDAFRPIVEDPFEFGRITANHCLNDLYAMGAAPTAALAQVTLPNWPANKLADELYQMLAGAIAVLEPAGASLVGGHTGEGSEISLGFTVTGTLEERRVFAKTGCKAGDLLVLTKPLGTGCLFAADMRAQARAESIDAAMEAMCLSNQSAAECLAEHDARAVTDVTGFGLAGHLIEMLRDGECAASIWLGTLPLLPGVDDVLGRGWVSSLHSANLRFAETSIEDSSLRNDADFAARFAVLFDPQTAGPLLASVPPEQAQGCVAALRTLGYPSACTIGRIDESRASGTMRIRLTASR